jgi:hypothetical protein
MFAGQTIDETMTDEAPDDSEQAAAPQTTPSPPAGNPYKQLFDQAPPQAPPPSANPYKALFDQDISRQNQQMMQSVSRAAGGDPKAAGEAQTLANQLGVGPDIVSANLPEARKQAQLKAIEQQQLLLRNPILARQLTDPRFAEIAHDDTANLSATEKTFQWIKGAAQSLWGGVEDLGALYVYGTPPPGVSQQWEAGQLQHEIGMLGFKAGTGTATEDDWARINQIQKRLEELGPAQGMLQNLVSMGGQMKDMGTGALTAAALSGLATGGFTAYASGGLAAPAVPEATMLGASFGGQLFAAQDIYRMTAGQTYLDMLKKGINPQTAGYAATGVGMANTALMQIGLKIPGKPFAAAFNTMLGEKIEQALVRPTLTRAAAGVAGEWALASAGGGATMMGQTLVSQMGEDLAKSYDQGQLQTILDTPEGRQEFAGRLADSFVTGLEMTAILHGTGSALKLRVEAERAAEAQRSAQFFTSLDKNASESEVRKRNPDAYENFIAAQAQDSGTENIYVDGRQMAQVLNQSGLSDEAIDQALPSVRDQLAQAAATGGDVVIPTAEFAKSAAGTELGKAMLPHMRLNPEAISPAEAIEAQKQQEQMIAEARTTAAQQMGANEDFAKSARVVEANIYDQLKATKTMPDDVARTNAQLMRDLVVTSAAKLGITPEEFYQRFPVTIGRAGEEGALAPEAPAETRYQRIYRQLAAQHPDWGVARLQQEAYSIAGPEGDTPVAGAMAQTLGVAAEPPVPEGMTRLYHGSVSGETEGPAWFSTNRQYAQNYRPDAQLQYVDVPTNELADRLNWDEATQGPLHAATHNLELDSSETGPRKVMPAAGDTLYQAAKEDEPKAGALTEEQRAANLAEDRKWRNWEPESTAGAGARGGFDPARLAITLGQHTDFSTFAHEASHYYLHVLGELAKTDAAEGPFSRDMGTLLKWFGVKDLDTWHSMSLEEQRKFHEQFAYSFEKYLADGKAPSLELQGVFDRFKQWMKRVYTSMRDAGAIYKREHGEELPAMTGEVRQVMDRMLASDEQIKQAEAVRNMEPLFGSAQEAGMTPEEFERYKEQAGQATDTAENQLGSASVRDLQWQSDARGRALKAVQAQHNTLRADMREGVAEEVTNSSPVYGAEHFLKTGEIRENGEVTGHAAEHKMDTDAVKALLQKEGEPEPDMSRFRGMTRKGGMDPDDAAQMMGFTDGRALVEALRDSRPLKEEIDAQTDQRMVEKYGEVATPEGMSRAVEQAVHNEARGRLIASELRHSLNSTESERVLLKAARAAAERIVAGKKLSELDPRAYAAREAAAARKARVAAVRGDKQLVIQAKRDQLLQHALAKAAMDARQEAEQKLDRLGKYDNPSKAITKAIGADHMDRINELLAGYELTRREPYGDQAQRQNIDAWVQSQFEKTGVMPAVSDTVTANLGKMHWRDMTIEQLRDLSDAVKSLDYTGRRQSDLEMEGKRITVDELIAEVQDALSDVPHSDPVDVRADMQYARGLDKINAKWLKFKSWVRSADSALLKMEQFFQWIDAGSKAGLEEAKIEGPMSRLFRMATKAEGEERTMRAESAAAMRTLGDSLKDSKINLYEVLSVPELERKGRGNRWYRGELIAMALNMGNQGNKEKMLLGYGWDEARAVGAINRLLSKPEMDFVQGVWDHISSYTDRVVDLERRQTGVSPKMVEPTPLLTSHGLYKGGYYPVVYDAFLDRTAEVNEARNTDALFENQYNRPATSKGHTVTRTGYTGPILMDLGVINRHLDQVTHDLAWREPIADMNKVLSDPRLADEIDQTYGREYRKQFRPWLQALANDKVFNTTGDSAWENFLRKARSNATMVGIGFRLSTMAIHGTSALSSSIGEIGTKWFTKGVLQFSGWDRIQEARDFIYDRSPEMQHRLETVDRNVQEVIDSINRQEAGLSPSNALTKAYNGARRFSMYGVSMVDMASAMPTWMGGYLKGMAHESEGGLNLSEADAVEYANRSVRNAHGGGGTKDLSALQRDKGIMSLTTMFYSFWNHMYNRERDLGKGWQTQFAGKSGTNNLPRLLARSWWYFVVPQLAHALLKPSPQQEDGTLEGFAKKTAEEIGLGFVSGVPVFRDMANAYVNGRDYTISPLEQGFKSIVQVFEDATSLVEGEPTKKNAYPNAAQAIGYTFGIPTAQPAATAKFLWDVVSGDADPESIADWYQGIMTGKLKH